MLETWLVKRPYNVRVQKWTAHTKHHCHPASSRRSASGIGCPSPRVSPSYPMIRQRTPIHLVRCKHLASNPPRSMNKAKEERSRRRIVRESGIPFETGRSALFRTGGLVPLQRMVIHASYAWNPARTSEHRRVVRVRRGDVRADEGECWSGVGDASNAASSIIPIRPEG